MAEAEAGQGDTGTTVDPVAAVHPSTAFRMTSPRGMDASAAYGVACWPGGRLCKQEGRP